MKSLRKNQGTWLAVILILGGLYVYKSFFASSIDAGTSAQTVGNNIVTLDQKIETVTLDQSLFTSAPYKALIDFTPALTPQPVGRAHPFDPIGSK